MAGKAKARRCILCNSNVNDPLRLGQLYTHGDITVHTYCMYLSSNLPQNGSDKSGIFGFLIPDIVREAIRSRRLICSYCRKRNASIGCSISNCRRSFHLACGITNGALSEFVGQFKSYCHRHLPFEPYTPHISEKCEICLEALFSGDKVVNPLNIIQSPCCSNGRYHKSCLQKYANTAGYFFKCPLCNNTDRFRDVALFGIFVQHRDAAWELEPDAFNELLERETVCTAVRCQNANGREASADELVHCQWCGSKPQHNACTDSSVDYVCDVCSSVNQSIVEDKIQQDKQSESETDPLDAPFTSFCVSRRLYMPQRLLSSKEENDDDTSDDPLDGSWLVNNPRYQSYLKQKIQSKQKDDKSKCFAQGEQNTDNHFKQQAHNGSVTDISCIAHRVLRRDSKIHEADEMATTSESGNNFKHRTDSANVSGNKHKQTESITTAVVLSESSIAAHVQDRHTLENFAAIGQRTDQAVYDEEPNIGYIRTRRRARRLSSTDNSEISEYSSPASSQITSTRSTSETNASATQSVSISTRRLSISSLSSLPTTRSSTPSSSLSFGTKAFKRTNGAGINNRFHKSRVYLNTTDSEEGNVKWESSDSYSTSACDSARNVFYESKRIRNRQQISVGSSSSKNDFNSLFKALGTSKHKHLKTLNSHCNIMQPCHDVSCIASRVRKRRSTAQEREDCSDDEDKDDYTIQVKRTKQIAISDNSCTTIRVTQRRELYVSSRNKRRKIKNVKLRKKKSISSGACKQ